LYNIKGKQKPNLEHKRCADGHENYDFKTTTASIVKLSFDSKSYDVKKTLRTIV